VPERVRPASAEKCFLWGPADAIIRAVRRLLFVFALAFAAACGPDPVCEGRTLRIIEPDDGESVPAGPVNVVVEVCDFDEGEIIALKLVTPVESDYGFITVTDPDQRLYGLEVPTFSGMTMELYAEGDGVVSDPVAFDVDNEE